MNAIDQLNIVNLVKDSKLVPVIGPDAYYVRDKEGTNKLYDLLTAHLCSLIQLGVLFLKKLDDLSNEEQQAVYLGSHSSIKDFVGLNKESSYADCFIEQLRTNGRSKLANYESASQTLGDLKSRGVIVDIENGEIVVGYHKFQKSVQILQLLIESDEEELDRVIRVINDYIKEQDVILTDDLKRLILTKKLNVFIVTSCDLLFESFAAKYRKDVVVLSVNSEDFFYELKQFKKKLRRNNDCTIIIKFLGSLLEELTPAISEKEMLNQSSKLAAGLSQNDDLKLLITRKRNNLLFYGCNFKDWYTRFILHLLGANWESKSGTIYFIQETGADSNNIDDLELQKFLRFHRVRLNLLAKVENCFYFLEPDDTDEDRLSAIDVFQANEYPKNAFISFSGKDRNTAEELKRELETHEIFCWVDKAELKSGSNIDAVILRAIEATDYFIPLISDNAKVEDIMSSQQYHCREWRRALDKKLLSGHNYHILPLRIDSSEWVPEELREFIEEVTKEGDTGGLNPTVISNLANTIIGDHD